MCGTAVFHSTVDIGGAYAKTYACFEQNLVWLTKSMTTTQISILVEFGRVENAPLYDFL